jgi:hypothetical protein
VKLGELSLVLEGKVWSATLKTEVGDSISGFGPTREDALRNLCVELSASASAIETRILAHRAFHYTGSDTFDEWWGKRE